MKTRKLIYPLVAVAFAALAFADTTTTRFGMTKPDIGSANWGAKLNSNSDIIDNAAGLSLNNTYTSSNTFTGLTVFSSQAQIGDGSAITPGLGFSSENGTGLYRSGTGIGAFSSQGTAVFSWSATRLYPTTTNAINLGDSSNSWSQVYGQLLSGSTVTARTVHYSPSGTASAPSYSFTGATSNGMYLLGTTTVCFATNGTLRVCVDNNGDFLQLNATFRAIGQHTANFADYSFIGDPNSGLRQVSSDALALTTNGSDVVTLSTMGVSILGTTTNDSPSAGYVGEYISSTTANFTSVPGTGNFGDLVSMSLTPGDWSVTASVDFDANSSTWSAYQIGISPTSGNSTSGLTRGLNRNVIAFGSTATQVTLGSLTVANFQVKLSATTTYYLKYSATYTAGTPLATGSLRARRAR